MNESVYQHPLPSAVVQVDDEGLVSKLLKRLVMVAVHVSCKDKILSL